MPLSGRSGGNGDGGPPRRGNGAWRRHIAALREADVHLVYGPDIWPLHEPRAAPAGRDLPWGAVLDAIDRAMEAEE